MKQYNATQIYILLGLVGVSILTSVIVFFDFDRPSCYWLLPLLPLTFAFCIALFHPLVSLIPNNLGASAIILLFFVRDVISPLFMCLGEYTVTITKNIHANTHNAILLVLYETLVVFATLFISFLLSRSKDGLISTLVMSFP